MIKKTENIFTSKPILIHAGWPKAASSFLQEAILINSPNTLYLGRPLAKFFKKESYEYKKGMIHEKVKKFIYTYDEPLFSSIKNEKLNEIINDLNSLMKSDINQIIISDEGFTSLQTSTKADRGRKADRLKLLFPKAKILFIIREQSKIIESQYGEYLRVANRHIPFITFKEYINISNSLFNDEFSKIQNRKGIIKDKYLKIISSGYFGNPLCVPIYNDVITHYENLFGKENIHISLFENLTQDSEKEINRISKETGFNIPQPFKVNYTRNTSMPTSYDLIHFFLRKYSFFNLIFKIAIKLGIDKLIQEILRYFGNRINLKWTEETKKNILKRYSDGNKNLANRYKLDLKDYP